MHNLTSTLVILYSSVLRILTVCARAKLCQRGSINRMTNDILFRGDLCDSNLWQKNRKAATFEPRAGMSGIGNLNITTFLFIFM